MMFKHQWAAVKPPRTVITHFPFGRPMGEPGNIAQQRVIALDALKFLAEAKEPAQYLELPYKWRREDYEAILASKEPAAAR